MKFFENWIIRQYEKIQTKRNYIYYSASSGKADSSSVSDGNSGFQGFLEDYRHRPFHFKVFKAGHQGLIIEYRAPKSLPSNGNIYSSGDDYEVRLEMVPNVDELPAKISRIIVEAAIRL